MLQMWRKGHFAKDYFSKMSEPSYKSLVTGYPLVSKGFQPKFTLKLIQSSQNSISQANLKIQKDYKAEYKKMKSKLALLEANPSTSQTRKTFQPKNKADDELTVGKNHARNGEWIDITMRKVNILLSMDEDADWQNYLKYINIDLKFVKEQRFNLLSKYNKIVFELNKCRDELLVLKQAKIDVVTFQIQNTKLTKLNHALQEQPKEEKKINEKWITSSKKVSQCTSAQIPHQKKKVPSGELFTESSSKMNEIENLFVPTSIGYDQEIAPKSKDWVERLNPDSKLPNFNTGRVLVPESQDVNESLEPTDTSITPESSKDSEAESRIPLPPLKNLQGASPSSEIQQTELSKSVDSSKISQDSKPKVQNTGSSKSLRPKRIQRPQLKYELCHYTNHSTDDCYRILYFLICKRDYHRTSYHDMNNASLKRSENYKAQPYQYASPSKQILKAKAKPFPLCTHYGFNNHRPNDCRNYPECEIYGSYDHFT
ncbi:hypothetical protein Tco_0790695 [Tanacetum coccineum]